MSNCKQEIEKVLTIDGMKITIYKAKNPLMFKGAEIKYYTRFSDEYYAFSQSNCGAIDPVNNEIDEETGEVYTSFMVDLDFAFDKKHFNKIHKIAYQNQCKILTGEF